MDKCKIISLRENPEYLKRAIDFYSLKWNVPRDIYEDSMTISLTTQSPLPRWFLMLKEDEIIGSYGLITNDVISRQDLWPWLCAVYIEEKERGKALSSKLLEHGRIEAAKLGYSKVYLCTDHIGLYEKYGWSHFGFGYLRSGTKVRLYENEAIKTKSSELAYIAIREANKHFHGNCMGSTTNLHPLADLFPYTETWTIDSWDNCWCSAFVFYCLRLCGYELPVKPEGDFEANFGGCTTWAKWSKLPEVDNFISPTGTPQIGDIVLFQNVYNGKSPDHIGILINFSNEWVETAEGNFNNVSAIVKRPKETVYGYIRLGEYV